MSVSIICRGNTNAKAKDYERALEIAHQTRRPVKFILCHPEYGGDCDDGELLTLPWVPLDELLKRNLYRLQSQGRYIPAFAIADCSQRVTTMIPPNFIAATTTTAATTSDSNPNNVEQFLVGLASPQHNVHNNRQRNSNQKRTGASFKYILTKHHLIQKQYPKQNNQHNYNNNNTTATRRTNNNSYNYNDKRKGRYNGDDSNNSYQREDRNRN
ncbi:MAG: hypothetical protein ACI8RD_009536 [Bacillariaceae sp.]